MGMPIDQDVSDGRVFQQRLEWPEAKQFVEHIADQLLALGIVERMVLLGELLGERADKSLIRTGADLCMVEAVFAGDDLAGLHDQLAEAGIEPAESEVIIKRSISTGGANRQFVNGSPTTLAVLKEAEAGPEHITRMTWFVPSRIECTRKSRQKRSIG